MVLRIGGAWAATLVACAAATSGAPALSLSGVLAGAAYCVDTAPDDRLLHGADPASVDDARRRGHWHPQWRSAAACRAGCATCAWVDGRGAAPTNDRAAVGLFAVRLAPSVVVTAALRATIAAAAGTNPEEGEYVASKGRGTQLILLHCDAAAAARVSLLPRVASAIRVPPLLKVSPRLRNATHARRTDLIVQLGRRFAASPDALAAIAARWSASLGLAVHTRAHDDARVALLSLRYLVVRGVPRSALDATTVALAAQPEAAWVDERPEAHVQFQSGWSVPWLDFGIADAVLTQQYSANTALLRTVGLDGTGEVLGIADSGLDLGHCLLANETMTTGAVPADLPTNDTFYVRLNNRKLAVYIPYADHHDGGISKHGTNTAALAVGSDPRGASPHDGAAPGAKIAFFDVERSTARDTVILPPDLGVNMLGEIQTISGAGVFLFPLSTTTSPGSYSTDAHQIDTYMWEHQDFLVVLPTGNGGRLGWSSIYAPGTAKSVLTVGASNSPNNAFVSSIRPANTELDAAGKKAMPLDVIYNVTNPSNPIATGLLWANNTPPPLPEQSIAYFSAAGPAADGRIKPEVVAPGYRVFSAKSASTGGASCEWCGNELSAPGDCSGSSKSSALVAGQALKVRQYFRQGWLGTGRPSATKGFTPRGSLIKAVIINGAQDLGGIWAKTQLHRVKNLFLNSSCYGATMECSSTLLPPSKLAGFGVVHLAMALPILTSTAPVAAKVAEAKYGFKIAVAGVHSTNGTTSDVVSNQIRTYKVVVTSNPGTYLRATLVWTDYPAAASASTALVNDLDLCLESPSGQMYGVNGLAVGVKDQLNTVEQTTVPTSALEAGAWTVTVTGASVPSGPQPFALVVRGPLDLSAANSTTTPEGLLIPAPAAPTPTKTPTAPGATYAPTLSPTPINGSSSNSSSNAAAGDGTLPAEFMPAALAFGILTVVVMSVLFIAANIVHKWMPWSKLSVVWQSAVRAALFVVQIAVCAATLLASVLSKGDWTIPLVVLATVSILLAAALGGLALTVVLLKQESCRKTRGVLGGPIVASVEIVAVGATTVYSGVCAIGGGVLVSGNESERGSLIAAGVLAYFVFVMWCVLLYSATWRFRLPTAVAAEWATLSGGRQVPNKPVVHGVNTGQGALGDVELIPAAGDDGDTPSPLGLVADAGADETLNPVQAAKIAPQTAPPLQAFTPLRPSMAPQPGVAGGFTPAPLAPLGTLAPLTSLTALEPTGVVTTTVYAVPAPNPETVAAVQRRLAAVAAMTTVVNPYANALANAEEAAASAAPPKVITAENVICREL